MKLTSKSLHIRLIRHLREWHRKLGIIAAFFLIFLSLTGIALNHTDFLALAHKPINNPWLLKHYGIKPPVDVRFYATNPSRGLDKNGTEQQILLTDNFIWLANELLLESDEPIISLGSFKTFIFVVTEQSLYLYTQSGALIDRLDSLSGLPVPIENVAVKNDAVVIQTPAGVFQTDSDFILWQKSTPSPTPQWITPIQVSSTAIELAQQKYQSQFLTVERLIVDAHSGRLFGQLGVLFMDFVALLLILLSLSGIYIWIRYARSKR
jgi:hypothetical protein